MLAAGCGSKAGASPPATTRPHVIHRAPTATPQAPATEPALTDTPLPTATDAVPTPTEGPASTPTTAVLRPTEPPRPAAPSVLSASLRPLNATPGGSLHAVVTTGGAAAGVSLYLSSGPGGGNPLVFTLVRTSPGTWEATGTAPTVPGTYHYSIGVFDAAGHRSIADNDGWNIQVAAVSTPVPQVLTFPADIPLAPPFSYGNPVPATFNAAGRTINGAEVVSSTRTDVPATTVAQFYSTHLPRAGWTVDNSSVPGPGATAFTMVGTSGSRVCVVQYSAGTVQVFYGSLPAG